MVSLAQLWLPILLSSVFVFVASSILHMVLKFWHTPDYKGFSNEDEVSAALRKGTNGAGMYNLPYCTPESMKDPAMQDKFKNGPVGQVVLREPGPMHLGAFLGQWFAYCVIVTLLAAFLGIHTMVAGTPYKHVFGVIGLATFLCYGLGSIPNAIWWGHPWKSQFKHIIDGAIYAGLTAGTFGWLWPH